MVPLRIENSDVVMRGNGEDVRDLAIKIIDGCSVSRWEPTPEEIEIIKNGGSVELWVMGRQPAVMLKAVLNVEVD